MIQVEVQKVLDGRHATDLTVEHVGSQLVVRPGTVRAMKQEFVVDEDWEYDLVSSPEPRTILGYLVRDRDQDQPLRLFVDEVGANETPYIWHRGPFEAIYHLFQIDALAGQSPEHFVVRVFARRLPDQAVGGEG